MDCLESPGVTEFCLNTPPCTGLGLLVGRRWPKLAVTTRVRLITVVNDILIALCISFSVLPSLHDFLLDGLVLFKLQCQAQVLQGVIDGFDCILLVAAKIFVRVFQLRFGRF